MTAQPRIRLWLPLLAALLVLAAAPALAKKKRAEDEEAKEEKKPTATLKMDDFFEKKEIQASGKRREAIKMIKKIIADGVSEDREKPDLYFRLAELYWEEGQFWYMQAMAVDDDPNKTRGEKKREKRKLFKKQKKYQMKGINLYKSIVENYPTYYRNDEVLFYLAQNQAEMGLEKEALSNFRKLIKTYRKSKFVPDAYLAFGEYFFHHDNLDKSLRAYLKVATYKESKVYPYALYKIGWCYYNMGYFEKALKKFERVIELQATGGKDQRKIALRREAIKDLVRTYAQVGEPEAAKDYFLRIGGEKDYIWMLEGLAEGFTAQGMDENSTIVFRGLIALNDQNPKNPAYQGEIVENTQRLGDKKRTVDEVGVLVDLYKLFLEQGHSKKVVKKTTKKVTTKIRRLTKIYHQEAQKTKSTKTYKVAFRLYELYLGLFPDSPEAQEMRFYYADLAYRLRKYKLAADEYTKVLLASCNKARDEKHQKVLEEAAFGAVSALEKHAGRKLRQIKKSETMKRKGVEYKAEPLPEFEKDLLEACGNYVKCVPQGKNALDIAYKSALLFYKRNHFAEAVKRFSFITENHPKSSQAEFAANLILDSFNLLKNYPELNKWSRKFLADPEISKKEKGKMRARLVKLIEESQFKIVEKMAEGEKGRKVAEAWLAFVKEFPKSSVGDLALYNASVHFTIDKMLDRAMETRFQLVKNYPKSKLLAKTMYQLAANYEQLAEWEQAAKQLEGFYKLSEKGKARSKEERDFFKDNADKALKRAGIYREALTQYRKAVDNCETYAKQFRKNDDAGSVYYRTAMLHEKARQWKSAEKVYRKYSTFKGVDPNLVLEASTRRGLMLLKQKKIRDANKAFVNTLKLYNNYKKKKKEITAGEQWVAHASFILAENTFNEFKSIKLQLPQKKLEKLLIKKADLLQKVEQRYKQILEFKRSDWPIAALFKIGLAYQHFAKALIGTPVPPGLTPEQIDIYKSELENRAIPVEEKALEAFQKALAASARLNLYNEWVKRAERKMAEVRPEDFPLDVELLPVPQYLEEGFVGSGLVPEKG